MTELENLIRTYAFVHDCDLDEAALHVLEDLLKETTTYVGLYDRMFRRVG